ncbi:MULTISPECIES: TetR/AcrR family transcriptional regulator [unclassified Rhodococcus (in: high G+C Gram-positive bacteria)]|uniref:TetR/AcrR family transcriptional regulator n=1 Tax=unclassified Rhodococcus (in: high G+C Gram-positive bacteria) TaxID=192944 RepID=UPI00163A8AD1|nr:MULTISPECIES: TetR/AcrR family transcriptional regulator [unclassified Rhodococcus (in: high G+C Gram-positive bacteria)]MBC2637700.1 TetR/AcrR family transcriptional regulator [Rhodococcus sp. 3A]MBC2897556.1 TetR/AcrR family transcriptional regulator [Rhodococcus sp. 4CII]
MRVTGGSTRRRPRRFDGQSPTELAVFSATEQLLTEMPFEDISVAQIISRTGLSRANFYHYFANKYDVLVAMATQLFDDTYTESGPWQAPPGKLRARSMDASVRPTLEMWSKHGGVVCAVVEHMHSVPVVAEVWTATFDRFVSAVAEQIAYEREVGAAPPGAPSELIATVLVCGIERSFYVGTRALDARLPTADSAVAPIVALTLAAIYGDCEPGRKPKRPSKNRRPNPVAVAPASLVQPALAASETAATILEATNSLLMECALGKLSVARIIERAHASRATFYFYFTSKDDAFAALYRGVAETTIRGLQELLTVDRSDTENIKTMVMDWLAPDERTLVVLRNALHEWPRRPELRRVYRDGMARMADVLETVITTDRANGVAPDGPPAAALSAVLLWTIERTVAGALAREDNLADFREVTALLAQLTVSAIYGNPTGLMSQQPSESHTHTPY